MKINFKSTVSMIVILSFLAMVAVCCCIIKATYSDVQKASCSHCASQSQENSTSHECCLTKVNPMEIINNLGMISPMPMVMVLIVLSFIYLVFYPNFVLRSLYLNGPPGFRTLVPLYIQSRSLRI